MVTAAQFRKLALQLPETEEKSHFEQPDFRVRGKIFADLDPEGTRGTLKLSMELQAVLLDSLPQAFTPAAGYWGRQGWTHVRLDAVELGALKDLMGEAWRMIAPKRLVAAESGTPSPVRQGSPARKRAPSPKRARTARKKR
jgi:hypothetical protein